MAKLFLPQHVLEEWAVGEKADVQGAVLSVKGEPTTYPVAEAVHFEKLVSGKDEQRLLGKVKTQTQLQSLGAEVMSNSAIVGESAYEVIPGYAVDAKLPKPKAPAGAKPSESSSEQDLLANFLLNKL